MEYNPADPDPGTSVSRNTLRILFVATKPPWPAIDGGRLLMARTLEGLAAKGHAVTLVAPARSAVPEGDVPAGCAVRLVPARPRSCPLALVLSQLQRRALSVVRHGLAAVRREVARQLDAETFDVVHAEQLQALAQTDPAFARGVPVVLRAQNVESDLWAATAREAGILGLPARREARRLARDEGEAVARARTTAALTTEDAERLRELSCGRGTVRVVRAPFPAQMPAGDSPLPGRPALVLLGSGGWSPNRDAASWFVSAVWPAVRAALPEARLHVYGHLRNVVPDGVALHPAPADSRDLFAPGSVMVVPLRIGSGVRMKILEAWARGVPVAASPQAVRGLDAEDGRELLVAGDVEGYVRAFRRLCEEPELGDRLAAGGREILSSRHDPARVLDELVRTYRAEPFDSAQPGRRL